MSFARQATRVAVRTAVAGICMLLTLGPSVAQEEIPEHGAMLVTGSVKVRAGEYERAATGARGEKGVISLTGLSGVELDLRDVIVRGMPAGADIDRATGYGIVLRECTDVTIRGGTLGGYRGCVVLENCDSVVIEDMRFEGWFGQRLHSTIAAENAGDWLRPHENDEGEWLANYGAAISMTDCSGVVVRNCRGRRGQNGILVTRSGGCQFYDNDFSFMSGWGIALYRSNQNIISRNLFDYCVRGYSHGVYWRGQDSAGILMFERCSDNIVAYNSATHGGDGLFLYAGQDIVEGNAFERGEEKPGGSDGNVFYRNDFSYAVANGIETTFSNSNFAVENVIRGCHQHGVWGGYSSNMVIAGNQIDFTIGGAITIEHGQECVIARNVLHNNEIGVELYWDQDPQFVDGPFGRHFDTSSRDHWIEGNSFAGNDSDLMLHKTGGLVFAENVFEAHGRRLHVHDLRDGRADGEAIEEDQGVLKQRMKGLGGWLPSGHISESSISTWGGEPHPSLEKAFRLELPPLPGRQETRDVITDGEGGLETIVMGRFGPWDYPSGNPRPEPIYPGGVLAGVPWRAKWFHWHEGPDPRGIDALQTWRALANEPVSSGTVTSWFNPWGGIERVQRQVGGERFGMIATASIELAGGVYKLSVLSDDGVRVMVNGGTVLENWTWHAPTRNEAELHLVGGIHDLTLEYFQIDGATALTIDLERLSDN